MELKLLQSEKAARITDNFISFILGNEAGSTELPSVLFSHFLEILDSLVNETKEEKLVENTGILDIVLRLWKFDGKSR